MTRLVFLVEERSMKTLLDNLLPRLIHGIDFLCIPHEGKQDLETSIPRKLRAWREPGVQFIIVRDNDGGDCHAVKKRLSQLCFEAGKKTRLSGLSARSSKPGIWENQRLLELHTGKTH